jgi:hypothetical protein
VTTELSSTTITNILEAVPGIKTVLRSPAADAMVNLTRAAVGLGGFDIKDARELMRFAFRRGLINNEEHDRVLAEVEVAARARQDRLDARKAARGETSKGPGRPQAAHPAKPKPHAKQPTGKPKAKPKAVPKRKVVVKKAKPVRKPASKGKPKLAKRPAKKPVAKAKAAKGKKRR